MSTRKLVLSTRKLVSGTADQAGCAVVRRSRACLRLWRADQILFSQLRRLLRLFRKHRKHHMRLALNVGRDVAADVCARGAAQVDLAAAKINCAPRSPPE